MIVVAVPFQHIHVWEIVVRCDTKSTIIAITVMMSLTSYIGLTGWICAKVACRRDWRLWNENGGVTRPLWKLQID